MPHIPHTIALVGYGMHAEPMLGAGSFAQLLSSSTLRWMRMYPFSPHSSPQLHSIGQEIRGQRPPAANMGGWQPEDGRGGAGRGGEGWVGVGLREEVGVVGLNLFLTK